MPGDFKRKAVTDGAEDEGWDIISGDNVETINFSTNFKLENAEHIVGTNWNVSKDDPNYKSIEGIIYSKDGKKIVRLPKDRTVLEIANGCESFCLQSIFYSELLEDGECYPSCVNLQKIIIPDQIKIIAANVFRNKSYIKNVILPEGIEEIGESAFESCNRLENINLPNSLKK